MTDLPITRVRVFEDRAQVTRSGPVEVETGTATVTVEGISPLAVDRTVDATAGDGVRVVQVRVRRWLDTVRHDRLANDAELQRAYDDAGDDVRRRRHDLDERQRQVDHLISARGLLFEEISTGANEAPLDVSEARRSVALLSDAERSARIGLVGAQAALRDAQRELSDLEARLRGSALLSNEWRAALDIELQVEEGGSLPVEVSYVVPNAAWRPAHVATRTGDDTVSVRSEAVVWQATDEPWEGVELELSTARTSRATDPPPVDDDVLRLVETGKEIEVEWREVENIGDQPAFVELPSVDDGGEARRFRVEGSASVPADGLPMRLPIGAFTAAAVTDLVCRPELERVVHRRSRQVNESGRPLLAGPVLLIEDGGVSGWTTIAYVGPGERFELGWGPEIAIAVDRRVERKDDDTITGATATDHRVVSSLHHNGSGPLAVEVIERVPVSEIDRVKVTVDRTHPEVRPDADGLLHWTVALDAGGSSREVSVAYTVRKHRTVAGG